MPLIKSEVYINQDSEQAPIAKRKWQAKSWIIIGIIVLLFIVLLGFLLHAEFRLKQAQKSLNEMQKATPQTNNIDENKELLEKVGKLVVLPVGETPTIATVSDLSKLKDQPFFAKAQPGDKVLIYSTAKRAILYRPSTNQIIELAPLITGTNNP